MFKTRGNWLFIFFIEGALGKLGKVAPNGFYFSIEKTKRAAKIA